VKGFAQRKGADLIRILNYTGFKTPTEYIQETSRMEKVFFNEAVKQFEEQENERNEKILNAMLGK